MVKNLEGGLKENFKIVLVASKKQAKAYEKKFNCLPYYNNEKIILAPYGKDITFEEAVARNDAFKNMLYLEKDHLAALSNNQELLSFYPNREGLIDAIKHQQTGNRHWVAYSEVDRHVIGNCYPLQITIYYENIESIKVKVSKKEKDIDYLYLPLASNVSKSKVDSYV
jgi:hypothetical protein